MYSRKMMSLILCFLTLTLIFTGCKNKDQNQIEETIDEEIVKVEEEVIISVSTVKEFLEAIGPDRTIEVSEGKYDLLSVLSENEYVKYEETYDGKQLVIHDVKNLKIIGDKDSKAEFLIEPRYSNVMVFKDVDNISIKNIIAGHTKDIGECSGGVLQFIHSKNILLENLDLYGCGTIGIDLKDCEEFKIINPNIYECSYNAFRIENSSYIEVTGGKVFNNTVFNALIEVLNSKQIIFNDTIFTENRSFGEGEYEAVDYFVMNTSDTPINFNNCTITKNNLEYFYFKKEQYSNCLVKDNKFLVETDEKGLYNNTYIKRDESWYEIKIKESTDWISSINKSNVESVRKKAVNQYKKIIEELGLLDLNGIPTALDSFKKMSKLIDNKSISDDLFVIFLDYYTKYIEVASYSMYSYSDLDKIYTNDEVLGFRPIEDLTDENLKIKVDLSIDSGIQLNSFYDNIYLSESSGFIVSNVSSYVSEGMIRYLELRELEIDKTQFGYDDSEEIYIKYYYGEIDSLVKWEKFYHDYPNFSNKKNILNYANSYEYNLRRPFENVSREINENNIYNQNDIYMINALDMLVYDRLFELYPYSIYTSKYKDIIEKVKKNNNIITEDLKDDLIEKKLIDANGNYDLYFENSQSYFDLISKFKTDLYKFKKEIKEETPLNISTDIVTVNVDNIFDMFDEIADNKRIVMKSGVYKVGMDFLRYTGEGNRQNIIKNVENLVLESDSEEPVILLLDYGVVLKFDTCQNILLNNFILGHSTDICNGNVVEVVDSKNVNINNSLLFGSGYIGLYIDESENVSANRTLITDTTTNPISIIDSKNIEIKNSRIYENYVPYIFDIDNSSFVTINSTQVIFNSYDKALSKNGKNIIKMEKVKDITIKDSYFIDNKFDNIFAKEFDGLVHFIDNITN